MNSRITLYMTLAVVLGIIIILGINIADAFGITPSKYISPNEVRGSAIEHHNTLYTLNFNQQNTLIEALNQSVPISVKEQELRKEATSFDFDKIIIYRFDAPDIEIYPIAFVSKGYSVQSQNLLNQPHFIYSAPIWNPQGLMENVSLIDLKALFAETYDH